MWCSGKAFGAGAAWSVFSSAALQVFAEVVGFVGEEADVALDRDEPQEQVNKQEKLVAARDMAAEAGGNVQVLVESPPQEAPAGPLSGDDCPALRCSCRRTRRGNQP